MNEAPLPPNVYRLPQRRFDAIPGATWVYWIDQGIRDVFANWPMLGVFHAARRGLASGDNTRFYRFWWEVPASRIGFGYTDRSFAEASGKKWFPLMKGGEALRWYGNQEHLVNWKRDGQEIQSILDSNGRLASRPQNQDYYFRPGVTWSALRTRGMSVRLMPTGFIFSDKGDSAFSDDPTALLGLLNSSLIVYLSGLIAGTMDLTCGTIAKLPLAPNADQLSHAVSNCIRIARHGSSLVEKSFDFIAPDRWPMGLNDLARSQARLVKLERQIDDEVYRLYGISDADRAAIEAELEGGGTLDHEDGAGDEDTKPEVREAGDEDATAGAMAQDELAVRWISYAVGVVLGRFQPGVAGALGRAVYRRDNFAIGSLPAPDEAEFDELVGPVERFAYVDGDGGRHVFSAEVEQVLRDLALPDGIAVLDEGHPRDLPALVERTLALMLGEQAATEVIQVGAANNLRKFLEKDFFTRWHLRWYRKRPVYWPLQSARRGYGFVLFHEKVEKHTLYVLLRDYLDHKLNGLRLQIEDLLALAVGQTGAVRRQTERQLDRARQLLDEVNVFAQTIDRIAKGGYQPEANWIDDGVILRLAPMWELIPIWKAEPKKTWERLEQGDYDWSHIAMAYWPARVRAACRVNKSFAIAHGHEEWYTGA